jgi:hypothetical protein
MSEISSSSKPVARRLLPLLLLLLTVFGPISMDPVSAGVAGADG